MGGPPARAAFLRYDRRRGRGCCARIRILDPGCGQTCLEIAPNRAQLVLQPGLYDGDSGDADYDDKGKHDRVFYRRWIFEECHRDPGLGLSVRGRLLKGHAGSNIFQDDDRGGKEAAEQRIRIRRLPGRDDVSVERRRLRVISGVDMERALEHASRLRDRPRNVELRGDRPDVEGKVEHKGYLPGEHTAGWHYHKHTDDADSNCLPVSFHLTPRFKRCPINVKVFTDFGVASSDWWLS